MASLLHATSVTHGAESGELPLWAFGFALGVFGYTFCGMGMNLIKLSHVKQARATPLRETPLNKHVSSLHANVLWVGGYFVNFLGGMLNIAGLRFAAQSLLAPLSTMALLSNALFATFLLGERLSLATDALPMVLIPLGNVLAVSAANHSEQRGLTVSQIGRLFKRPVFAFYIAACISLATCLMFLRRLINRRIRQNGGLDFASPTLVAYSGLCHAAAAAMICVNAVFLSKACLLVLADGIQNALRPQFVVLLTTYLTLVCFWVYTLNTLLAAHDVLFIVPVIEVLWSLCSMVGGGIFFDEYSGLTSARKARFFVGVLLSISGVFMLSRRVERSRSNKLG